MQLGFVIDHSRCIGCHACTVACKSENEVPLGSFRTWVKYTEQGEFPEVRRSFAVLRCNQCTNAPCVTICPVSALEKRSDGIVDVDPKACIGCKACMHGCPYDALYINPEKGTAEKCHFCAHRSELGLAPACAVVCPTEAIIPGDFDDPQSRVSRLRKEFSLAARKVEAGTGPNVLYREVSPAGIDPGLTNLSGGFLWSEAPSGARMDAQTFEALERKAAARTVYDVPRDLLWGSKITGYLFAKSLAAGVFPAAFLALAVGGSFGRPGLVPTLISLAFLALTGLLLVVDLKRPERFWKILVRPNWSSWLARGTFVITGYGALLTGWLALHFAKVELPALAAGALGASTIALGAFTAIYTAFLFAQAKGRVLWMKRGYWAQLLLQSTAGGSATLLLFMPMLQWSAAATRALEALLALSIVLGLVVLARERKAAPAGREEEYARALSLVTKGPYSAVHHGFGIVAGSWLPLAFLAIQLFTGGALLGAIAGALALVGLWVVEDVFVRAGQSLPIS